MRHGPGGNLDDTSQLHSPRASAKKAQPDAEMDGQASVQEPITGADVQSYDLSLKLV